MRHKSNPVLKLRVRLEVTQTELAQILGSSGRAAIHHYEKGITNTSGIVNRFLAYLLSLSDPELKKTVARLQSIADEEEGK